MYSAPPRLVERARRVSPLLGSQPQASDALNTVQNNPPKQSETMVESEKKQKSGAATAAAAVIKRVAVQPQAAIAMAAHCQTHPNESVHGILLGRCETASSSGVVVVTEAIAVSHGAPSRPVVEAALGLVLQNRDKTTVVAGWYTAPMLLEDTRPGPVALRMAANLASTTVEPVLLVVQNQILGDCTLSGKSAATLVQALGRDFGNQWLEKIITTLEKPEAVGKAIQLARKQEMGLGNDLLDHWEDVSKVWYPNTQLSDFVKKID